MPNIWFAIIVFFAVVLPQIACSGYWEMPWNAVHDRPVFRFEPSVKWNFSHPSKPSTLGKIVISDDTGDMLFANNKYRGRPWFFILNKQGQQVFAWNSTADASSQATVTTYRNNVVYLLTAKCSLLAVSVPSGGLLWNRTICQNTNSITPITWLKNDTVMVVVTSYAITTVRASDGTVLMSYNVPSTYLMPPMPSSVDDKFIFHASNDTVFKLDVMTGQVIWSTSLFTTSVGYSDRPPPPSVDADGSIYVPTYNGFVFKLHANGTQLWATSAIPNLEGTENAPINVNSTHLLVISGYNSVDFFVVRKADGQVTTIYSDVQGGFQTLTGSSQVYWNKNVLYVLLDYGEFGAWDTTDLTGLKFLWRKNFTNLMSQTYGATPSIMKDGTLIIPASYSQGTASLVALGCPDGFRVSTNGTLCLCFDGSELKNGTCVQCSSNQYANETTAGCQVCNAGLVPNDMQSGCSKCPDGTFSRAGDPKCTPCSADPSNKQCFVPVSAPISAPVSAPISAPAQAPTNSRVSSASSRLPLVLGNLLVLLATLLW